MFLFLLLAAAGGAAPGNIFLPTYLRKLCIGVLLNKKRNTITIR